MLFTSVTVVPDDAIKQYCKLLKSLRDTKLKDNFDGILSVIINTHEASAEKGSKNETNNY